MLRSHRLATLVLGFIAAVSGAQASDIYVLTGTDMGWTNSPTDFGKIDTTTGQYSLIKSGVAGSNLVEGLAWNPNAGNFYTTENTSSNTTLRTIELNGNLSSQIGANVGRQILGMVYRPSDNLLYAYSNQANTQNTGTISPTNGGYSVLNNNTGWRFYGPEGGRYALLNDTIYMAAGTASSAVFGTVGWTSTSTFQQIVQNNISFNAAALATDGTTLYTVDAGTGTNASPAIFSIDLATGNRLLVKGIYNLPNGNNTLFYGAAFVGSTNPVPEPSTYALGAIATGVMAVVARRRKAKLVHRS